MQDAAFEVESNILATERLEDDAECRSQGGKSSSSSEPEIDKLARMIKLLTSEVSKLKVEQYSKEAGAPCSISLLAPNLYKEANEHMQILQRKRDTNEDKGERPLLQNIVMKEVYPEEEVSGLEGAPFLTRAAYEEALAKSIARQSVVATEQQVD